MEAPRRWRVGDHWASLGGNVVGKCLKNVKEVDAFLPSEIEPTFQPFARTGTEESGPAKRAESAFWNETKKRAPCGARLTQTTKLTLL